MNNVKIFFSIIGLLILGVIVTVVLRSGETAPAGPGKYDTFAQCLTEKGATFYGAFWCPHCNAQKKMFGSSAKLLPYVECSTADGNSRTQICIDKKIEGYPTWEFANSFNLESAEAPNKCDGPSESSICKNSYRSDRGVWVVGSTAIASLTEPTQNGTQWTFAPLSLISGEVPLETLAKVTSCELPL